MADRKLNEISSATDFANAYTEDESGNQVKISKADMASVLAAINGYGLKVIAELTSSNDLNNINDGVYSTRNADNPINCPDGIYNNILIQITSPIRYDVFQILFSANARSIYIRTRLLGSTWYDWEKIATTAL